MKVADIAAMALNAVSPVITDAVHSATVTRTYNGAYDVTNGVYQTITVAQTGRVVFSSTSPGRDMFPGYVVGPSDEVLMLEGFTDIAENDVIMAAGRTLTIMAAQDIGGAGTLFNVAAR